MHKDFSDDAWADYTYWIMQDKKILKKINQLLADIERNGNDGIGHPEPLKGNLSGYWSRAIDEKHRLVYKIEDGLIKIIQCKNQQPRRRASGYVVLIRWLQSAFIPFITAQSAGG